MNTTEIIVLVGFALIILYQSWRLIKVEDKFDDLENVFLMVLLKLNGVDVDGTSNRE